METKKNIKKEKTKTAKRILAVVLVVSVLFNAAAHRVPTATFYNVKKIERGI